MRIVSGNTAGWKLSKVQGSMSLAVILLMVYMTGLGHADSQGAQED
jgi:hypothetical protein